MNTEIRHRLTDVISNLRSPGQPLGCPTGKANHLNHGNSLVTHIGDHDCFKIQALTVVNRVGNCRQGGLSNGSVHPC